MTRAVRATKIACDNRKQKSCRVNRPLEYNVHLSPDMLKMHDDDDAQSNTKLNIVN